MGRATTLILFLSLARLDPTAAQEAEYLTGLEAEIVREHNLARQNPRRYASYVEELLPYFDGTLLRLPGEIALRTQEGSRAVSEAVRFLRAATAAGELRPSRGMSRGARDHVRDHGPRARTGHEGSDGSQSWDRVNRYGTWRRTIGENIAFGAYDSEDARMVVMQLIIDDGVADRGHRDNIFEPEFEVIGVSCGEHARYGLMCVMVYAGRYEER